LTRVKASVKKDAAARVNFMMVLEIWGDEVRGPRGEFQRVGEKSEREHNGIYTARLLGPVRAHSLTC